MKIFPSIRSIWLFLNRGNRRNQHNKFISLCHVLPTCWRTFSHLKHTRTVQQISILDGSRSQEPVPQTRPLNSQVPQASTAQSSTLAQLQGILTSSNHNQNNCGIS